MKPIYLKVIAGNQVSFIKVVRNRSFATAGILIQSSENLWTTQAKMFDLNKEKNKQEYVALIEGCLESNRDDFDEASRQVLRQADASLKKGTGRNTGKK